MHIYVGEGGGEPRCGMCDGEAEGSRARWRRRGGGTRHRSSGEGDRRRAALMAMEETDVESGSEETSRDLEFWDESETKGKTGYYL
jgi:hypothetical protein